VKTCLILRIIIELNN